MIVEEESKPVTREERKKKKVRGDFHRLFSGHSVSQLRITKSCLCCISAFEVEERPETDEDDENCAEKTFVTQYPASTYSERDVTTTDLPSTASPKKHTRQRLTV